MKDYDDSFLYHLDGYVPTPAQDTRELDTALFKYDTGQALTEREAMMVRLYFADGGEE